MPTCMNSPGTLTRLLLFSFCSFWHTPLLQHSVVKYQNEASSSMIKIQQYGFDMQGVNSGFTQVRRDVSIRVEFQIHFLVCSSSLGTTTPRESIMIRFMTLRRSMQLEPNGSCLADPDFPMLGISCGSCFFCNPIEGLWGELTLSFSRFEPCLSHLSCLKNSWGPNEGLLPKQTLCHRSSDSAIR